MSKLSFRARALDTTKPMPVLRAEDVPDLPDFAAINRAVPQMPTGMEKEEECEHHLQRAISAQQAFGRAVDHVIPTPEVFPVNDKEYDELYPPNFKVPRTYIHLQLQSFEQDHPEYNMDSEDEEWVTKRKHELELMRLIPQQSDKIPYLDEKKFENIFECLEKNSGIQKVIDLSEAKALLVKTKEDDSLVISVYDYWLNKKLQTGKSLLPTIKTEKRDGSSGNNPYIAFRRRTEKMQTRKNRKNDETSYEKMLKLKRDFSKVRDLLGLVKKREVTKKQELETAFDIYKKRYLLGDFNGNIFNEIMASRYKKQQEEQALVASNQAREKLPRISKNDENAHSRRKRDYKKRPKHEITLPQKSFHESGEYSSEDENANDILYQGSQINQQEEIDDNPDGQFAFKRKKGCNYHAPLEKISGWEWDSPHEGGLGNRRYRYSLTSLSRPPIYIGLSRRRIGRGGRLIFDRTGSPFNDFPNNYKSHFGNITDDINDCAHFKPVSPLYGEDQVDRILCYNSQNFSDDESTNSTFVRLKNEDLLEDHLYKYNENNLSNRTNDVVCNAPHSLSENLVSSPSQSSKPSSTSKQSLKSRDVNSNLLEMNASRSFLDSINADIAENLKSNENRNVSDFDMNNVSFPDILISEDSTIDDIVDPLDPISFLNSNNCDRVQPSKLDNLTRSSNDSLTNNMINNGSDYLHSSDIDTFSREPSVANEIQPSSTPNSTTIDAKTNIVSSQNSVISSNASNFTNLCKMKLPNNRNLHPTDVT